MKHEKLLRNTAFGLFMGSAFTLLFMWVLDGIADDDWKKFASSIFSVLAAFAGSTLALLGVFSNIENQKVLSADARARKLVAAKAFLPAALSKLCELSAKGVRYSYKFESLKSDLGIDSFREKSLNDLGLSDDTIGILKEVIECSDDKLVQDRIGGLLREHQMLYAQWGTGFDRTRVLPINHLESIQERPVSWAYIYAISCSMFDFARNETDTVDENVNERDIRSALNFCSDGEIDINTVKAAIEVHARDFPRRFILA